LLASQDEVWGELTQRLDHEPAQVGSRVGQGQSFTLTRFRSKRNEVQIERARLVENSLGLPSEAFLQFLELSQQRIRSLPATRDQPNHCIRKDR